MAKVQVSPTVGHISVNPNLQSTIFLFDVMINELYTYF